MQPMPNSQELAQIMRFVQSPAGQQLLASLQQLNSSEINSAMEDAAAGNYDRAQKDHRRVSRDSGGKKAAVPSGRRQMSEMEEKAGGDPEQPPDDAADHVHGSGHESAAGSKAGTAAGACPSGASGFFRHAEARRGDPAVRH